MIYCPIPKGHTIVYRGESVRSPLKGRPFKVPDSHWYTLPTPQRDGIDTGLPNWDWFCGCTRKTDIFKWWKKKDFSKHPKNFKIRVFIVPKEYVIRGNTQCIFNRRKAKPIGTLNPDGYICLTSNT
jgi:hypothetical protein